MGTGPQERARFTTERIAYRAPSAGRGLESRESEQNPFGFADNVLIEGHRLCGKVRQANPRFLEAGS